MAEKNEEASPPLQPSSKCFQDTRTFFKSTGTNDVRPYLSTTDKRAAAQHERDLVEEHDRSLMIISTVGTLLCAVSVALVSWQRSSLKPERAEAILHAILFSLGRDKTPDIPPTQEAPPDGADMATTLFKTSFTVSVLALYPVILVRGYLFRQHKCGARRNRQLKLFSKSIMITLLIALGLLVCGLGQQAWYIKSSVAYALAPLAVPGVGMYLWMAITAHQAMVKKDENVESSPLERDSKRPGDAAGASPQPTETHNNSNMMDEREAARYVNKLVKSHNKILNTCIFMSSCLFLNSAGMAVTSHYMLRPYIGVRSVALLRVIMLTLKPDSEIPVLPFVPQAHPRGMDTAVALFYASSMFFLSSATFAALLKPCLNRFSLHEGGSMIERRAELERWGFNRFVRAFEVMNVTALFILFYGAFKWAVMPVL